MLFYLIEFRFAGGGWRVGRVSRPRFSEGNSVTG